MNLQFYMNPLLSVLCMKIRHIHTSGFFCLMNVEGSGGDFRTCMPRIKIPTYASLGVKPLINCMGTFTIISGSLPQPEVQMAMQEANSACVHMDELMEKVGQRLGELTGAEFGIVTSGAAAAIAVAACACVAGADPEKISLIPDLKGMKDEVIIPKSHRFEYDRAIRAVGVEMIEVRSLEEMKQNVSRQTAMIAALGVGFQHDPTITFKDIVALKNKHKIPLLVDMAAERPDVPNRYIQRGADMVAISGGKPLFGPQTAGILLGRKDLLQAAFLNSAPHHSFGRMMKISKDVVMGALAAMELWVHGRDHRKEWEQQVAMIEYIQKELEDIHTVHFEYQDYDQFGVTPILWIMWDADECGITAVEAHDALVNGEPGIKTNVDRGGLWIRPYTMKPGEERVVAQRIREVLTANLSETGDT